FSYGAERLYSRDRWCLTGEAGVFLDPLYSPGSDFITYSNTIVTQLVTKDLSGDRLWPSSPWRPLRSAAFFWIAQRGAPPPPPDPPFDITKLTQSVAADSPLAFLNFMYLR